MDCATLHSPLYILWLMCYYTCTYAHAPMRSNKNNNTRSSRDDLFVLVLPLRMVHFSAAVVNPCSCALCVCHLPSFRFHLRQLFQQKVLIDKEGSKLCRRNNWLSDLRVPSRSFSLIYSCTNQLILVILGSYQYYHHLPSTVSPHYGPYQK